MFIIKEIAGYLQEDGQAAYYFLVGKSFAVQLEERQAGYVGSEALGLVASIWPEALKPPRYLPQHHPSRMPDPGSAKPAQ